MIIGLPAIQWENKESLLKQLVTIIFNFYIGNNPGYEETVAIRPGWEWDALITQPAKLGINRPSEKSAYFLNRSLTDITADPLWWMGLLMNKVTEFWHGD